MSAPTHPADPAEEEYLRACQAPGCGFLVRWWHGPYCPTHTPKETDQ